jgi:hypothetical protein
MPGSDSKISVTGFGERSHAAAANRVRDETAVAGRAGGLVDHPGAGEGRVNRE